MILGGSNSGPKGGWAAALARIAPEHRIENKFLGAVGSLFGLLRLLKSRREGAKPPEVIVFEYTLNDSVWLMGKNISLKLVEATLHDVVTICARERIRLLFLCLAVRPPEPEGEAELSMFMNQFYRSVALSRGAADCLLQADILGGVAQSQYVDWLHIGPEAAEKVAQAVAARLRAPIPVPRVAARGRGFFYLDAAEARIEGAATRLALSSSVFDGPFLELARGGRSFWAAKGRLVAIMLRSTERSGTYRISAKGRAIRKNAQSLARDAAPNLMTLHYIAGEFPSASTVAIEMPDSEAELMALPYDLTLMDGPPFKPFEEQALEINGIMVHRPPSLIRRAIDAIIAR
jgi:hypothetical protein